MSLTADRFLDRMKLKSEILKWRTLAICLVLLLALVIVGKTMDFAIQKDYIARLPIEGIIFEDRKALSIIDSVRKDNKAKAAIIYINSPGGTMVGGESFYKSLRDLARTKPTVAVMGSMATSGGYMVAVAADHILASRGTITGSIGVILQTAEVSELSKKVGVKFITFKSGEFKGSPSPFEKLDPRAANLISRSINDSHEFFSNLVAIRRNIPKDKMFQIADGRIFTGGEALKSNLIDAIGDEKKALSWLYKEQKISSDLKIKEIDLKAGKSGFSRFYSMIFGMEDFLSTQAIKTNGIMALWSLSNYKQ